MEELLNELNRFREIRASATDPDTIKMADSQIVELEAKLGIQQQKQAAQEQKFDELKDYVESLDLSEKLGHPDAPKIAHALLFDQAVKHQDEIDAKDEVIAGHELTIGMLQYKVNELEPITLELSDAKFMIAKLTADNQKLQEDLDYYRKDATYNLNEVNRLKKLLQAAEQRLEDERKRRSDIKPSESLQQLLEGAKAVTEQRKRAITNVQPLNDRGTHYTAQDADTGEQLTIPHYMMPQYEQVERLRMPEDKPVTEADFPAGGQDVAGADLVHADEADTPSVGDDEAIPEAAPTVEDRVNELLDWKNTVEHWRKSIEERMAGLHFER